MNITLANFQIKAIADLTAAMEQPNRDIILKSCTGSGKTIILTSFMDEYFKSNHNTVFIWLTPGKGNLEEQSKEKMNRYIHGSQTKLLSDIMTSGFEENDACFINWEKLTNLIKAYYNDMQSNNRIKKISVKGKKASGQFEVDTDLMKMKHYLSVCSEVVTNEVNSIDFFDKAQTFIEEMRNKK